MIEMKTEEMKEKRPKIFQILTIFVNIGIENKTNWRKIHVKTTNWCRWYGRNGT